MDHTVKTNRRLFLLGGFLVVVLLAYVGVLYNTQVNQYDYYLAQSVRTIAREETVTASRGLITDRNGKALVSNRSSYNLTFDSSLLKKEDDENAAILRLLNLCQTQNISWVDNLPISKYAPFTYTVDQLSDTQRGRFLTYLQGQKLVGDHLKAPDLTAAQLLKMGLTPTALLAHMGAEYDLPAAFSPGESRAVLGVQYELALRKLDNYTAYILAEDIDATMISLLNDGSFLGAKITSASVREYETTAAAHILGTVGPIFNEEKEAMTALGYKLDDLVGKSGVESAFEPYLRGTDGRRLVSTNSEGKVTSELYAKEPQPGSTVELTIDLNLQKAMETALAETIHKMNAADGNTTRGAGAVVTKVGTGEVLALASYPTYDPAAYRRDYNALYANPARPLFNRATSGTYAPGSTFKPLTAVAALNEGVITPYQTIQTRGHWVYPGDANSYANCWIYNSSRGTHGSINITDAITVSCNYFFAEMGYRLGLDTLNKYAQAFGLGENTGIEIGDATGRLAENRAGENQAPWAAFGQADYLFTPIQLSNYIATLVSGGKHCDAHLLKAVKSYDNAAVLAVGDSAPKNTIDISPASLTAVKQGMHNLTTTGSLSSYFKACVVDAGAKTGTAQINKHTKNTGVLVCFAPYDKPEIALSIVIEEGGSGAALASAAVQILNAYFTADQIGAVVLGENQLLP
ncbi:MAG: penicillin-binding transpeptidase domain-containing protein [Oscillibacter sp.]